MKALTNQLTVHQVLIERLSHHLIRSPSILSNLSHEGGGCIPQVTLEAFEPYLNLDPDNGRTRLINFSAFLTLMETVLFHMTS